MQLAAVTAVAAGEVFISENALFRALKSAILETFFFFLRLTVGPSNLRAQFHLSSLIAEPLCSLVRRNHGSNQYERATVFHVK